MAEKIEPVVSTNVRRRIMDGALAKLPWEASSEERDRVLAKARAVMKELGPEATEQELIRAATRVAQAVTQECRRRVRRERWRERVPGLLSFGADQEDKREAVRIALSVLDDLPWDVSDWKVEEKIREALSDLRGAIQRGERIRALVEYGRARVAFVLIRLRTEEVISWEELFDSDLCHDLEQVVASVLEEDLDGSESKSAVDELVESLICDELDLEEDAAE